VDVVYVLSNFARLAAYEVDPQTGIPTLEGPPLALSANNVGVAPSANGRFLYVLGWNTAEFYGSGENRREYLWVYATDSNGQPGSTPIQALAVSNLYGFEVDPSGSLAFAIEQVPSNALKSYQNVTRLRTFNVDPETGLVSSSSRIVASYAPNGPCGTGWSVEGFLEFNGFNSDGSVFYDEWYCTTHDGIYAIYYAFQINLQTGHVGTATKVFEWDEDDSADGVWFTPRAVIDYADPAGVYGAGAVTVYAPTYPSATISTPLFTCNIEMLAACGSGFGGMPDPLGEFMFLQATTNSIEITRVDVAAKQLVDTGNSIPEQILQISSDRRLIYTQVPNDRGSLPIYTFNAETGMAREGGTIEAGGQFVKVIPVVRR